MASDSKEFLIKIISDATSVARTKSDIAATKRGLQDLETFGYFVGKSLGDLQRTSKLDALGAQFGTMAVKINDTEEAARRLSVALKAVNATGEETARATQAFFNAQQTAQDAASNSGTRGSALRLLGSQGRALPSMMTPLGIGTDQISNIARMAGAIGELTEKANISTGTLKTMGISAAALGVALVLLAANTRKVAEAAKADIDARNRAITLIQQSSKEDIQARINELENKRKVNAEIKANADALVDNLRQETIKQFGGGKALLAEGLSIVGLGAGELSEAKKNAEAAAKAVSETSVELDILTQQSGLTAQSAADLAAAERQLAEERGRAAFLSSDAQNRLTADIEAYQLAQNGTSEALKKRQQDLQTEIVLTENAIAAARYKLETEKLSEAEQNALGDVITSMTEKANGLKTTLNFVSQEFVTTAIAARELAQANIDAQKDLDKVALDIAAAEEKRASDIANIRAKEAESFRKLQEAFKQSGLEDAIKNALADAKRLRTQADEDAKALRQLDDKIADVNDARGAKYLEAEEKRNKAILEAQKKFSFDSANAIQDRNAVALDLAQRQKQKAIDDANTQRDQDKKDADKDREERIKELKRDFAAQQRETRIARQNQAREEEIARRADSDARRRKLEYDIQQLRQATQAEINQRNQTYVKQLTDLKTYLTDYLKSHKDIYGDVLKYAKKLQSDLNGLLGGSGGSTGGGSTTPPPLIPPGINAPPGFGAGAGAFNSFGGATAQSAGFTFAPVINGNSAANIRQQVNNELNAVLRAAGYN